MHKKILLIMVLLTSKITLGNQGSRTLECVSDKYSLRYKGHQLVGGAYGIMRAGSHEEIDIWDVGAVKSMKSMGENRFEIISSMEQSSEKAPAICSNNASTDFQEKVVKKIIELRLVEMSSLDEITLGLTARDTVSFQCEEILSTPIHCSP